MNVLCYISTFLNLFSNFSTWLKKNFIKCFKKYGEHIHIFHQQNWYKNSPFNLKVLINTILLIYTLAKFITKKRLWSFLNFSKSVQSYGNHKNYKTNIFILISKFLIATLDKILSQIWTCLKSVKCVNLNEQLE